MTFWKNTFTRSSTTTSRHAVPKTGLKNPFYGKTHSEDWKEKRQLLYKKKKEDGWNSPNKGVPKPLYAVKSMKENMPHRKVIIVDGYEYSSISECSKNSDCIGLL
ncbi:NUMOD3 domain-containing DNA-binding protein [Bacillus sp. N9]